MFCCFLFVSCLFFRLFLFFWICVGDGLTFNFASVVPIASQLNNPAATTQMNLWFESSVNQYDEENTGGIHEENPLRSSMTLTPNTGGTPPLCTAPLTPVVLRAGSSASVFCAVIQSSVYTSQIQGLLVYSSSALANSPLTYLVSTAQSQGNRYYTDLTGAVAAQYSTWSLSTSGSTGGNNNWLYPNGISSGVSGAGVYVDGDGLTLNFTASGIIPLIYGHYTDSSQTYNMNFWWGGSYYNEENKGNTHETAPDYSAMTLAPYTSGTLITYPSCPFSTQLQFTFCLSLASSTFLVTFSGLLNATGQGIGGIAKSYTASQSGLSGAQLGYVATSATGIRNYTNVQTGVSTVLSIKNLLPVNSFLENGQ